MLASICINKINISIFKKRKMVASTDDSKLFKKFARVARVDERSQWSIKLSQLEMSQLCLMGEGYY